MPPAYAKTYVKRGKTDAADAEAICEAATRPTTRFAPVKSARWQAALLGARGTGFPGPTADPNGQRHPRAPVRVRDRRGQGHPHPGPVARGGARRARGGAPGAGPARRPAQRPGGEDRGATARITAPQKADPLARRLATVPGLGPIASSAPAAPAATTPGVAAFRSARDHAAQLGLAPRARSPGGRKRLGRVSRAGNRCLRRRLHLGAMALISARRGRRAARAKDAAPDWLDRLPARKPVKVVAVALAARMARTIWALIARGESCRALPG